MFIQSDKQHILNLLNNNQIEFISLWDSIENAMNFYNTKKKIYTGYSETKDCLEYAYATPVKVFIFLNYSSSALEIL